VAGAASAFTYQPVIPTITSIGTITTGSAAGGTSISITGTGFLGNKAGDKHAGELRRHRESRRRRSCNSPRCQLVDFNHGDHALISQDSTYYVTATTFPVGGTSATNSNAVFTFVPFTPVAASVSPTSAGSQSVTITGIGFVSNASSAQTSVS